jgi:hypothetical protein
VIAAVLGSITAFLVGAAGSWLFPPLELLDDGQTSRVARWRSRIAAAAVTVALGVVASVIYGARRS